MDDSQIIDLFFARSELAISELDAKYGKVCHRLANNILGSTQDAEECVNDAYLGTWNAIPPQRPAPLLSFVCPSPPVFDHALPCQHSYETKQLLRCLHGGDRELHRRSWPCGRPL